MDYGTGIGLDWLGDIGAVREAASALDEADFTYMTFGGRVHRAAIDGAENAPERVVNIARL